MADVTFNPRAVRPVNDLRKRSLVARLTRQLDSKGRVSNEYVADFQFDLRDPENHFLNRTDPHLYTSKPYRQAPKGIGLTVDQMEDIYNAFPPSSLHRGSYMGAETIELTLRANLIPTRSMNGTQILLVDTRTGLFPSEFPWTPNMINDQWAMEQKCWTYGSMAMENTARAKAAMRVQRPGTPSGLRELSSSSLSNLDKSYE